MGGVLMIKDDAIIRVLLKYNFNLFRESKKMSQYMKEHLNNYYEDIINATKEENNFLSEEFIELLKEDLDHLKVISEEIVSVLSLYESGFVKDAWIKGHILFDRVRPFFLYAKLSGGSDGTFYRIRNGDFRIKSTIDSKKQKSELFHIKDNLRDRIGSYRYSVAGYPCLYLASDCELAWFECGMPKQFSYCRMSIDNSEYNALKLIDFSQRPVDFLSAISIEIINERRKKDNPFKVYEYLKKYIIMYPIIAACSVKVKNRTTNFIPEYTLPQMFMQWIREDEYIDGVYYKSSLNTDLINGMCACNVALPVKNFREDGLDQSLANKFFVSDIGYIDVSKMFEKYQKYLEELKTYKEKLFLFSIRSKYSGDYLYELSDLCDCIIKTYTALIENNYQNTDLIFTFIDNLFDHSELIYRYRKRIIKQCCEEAKNNFSIEIENIEERESQFEEFHKIVCKILYKHAVFSFNFDNLENFEKI